MRQQASARADIVNPYKRGGSAQQQQSHRPKGGAGLCADPRIGCGKWRTCLCFGGMAVVLLLAYLGFGGGRSSDGDASSKVSGLYLRATAGQNDARLQFPAAELLWEDTTESHRLKKQLEDTMRANGNTLSGSSSLAAPDSLSKDVQSDFPPTNFVEEQSAEQNEEQPPLDMGASYDNSAEESGVDNDDDFAVGFVPNPSDEDKAPDTAEELLANLANSPDFDRRPDLNMLPVGPAAPVDAPFGSGANTASEYRSGNLRSNIQVGRLPVDVLPVANQFPSNNQAPPPPIPFGPPTSNVEEVMDFPDSLEAPAPQQQHLGDEELHNVGAIGFETDEHDDESANGMRGREAFEGAQEEGDDGAEYQDLPEELGFANPPPQQHLSDADVVPPHAWENKFHRADDRQGDTDGSLSVHRRQRAMNEQVPAARWAGSRRSVQ